jgi:hypothetical protein
LSLTERPHIISFSKNEIRYVFLLTDLTRPGLYLQVKLLYGDVGTTPITILQTFDLKPDSVGNVYLYIQQYLDSLLDYVVPSISSRYTTANKQACNFFIHYREITDADQDPDWIETEQSSYYPRTAVKGGIEKHKQSRNNFFIHYFPVQKPFLTWLPSGRFVFPDENIFLSFLNQHISTAGYKIRVTAYNTAGTSVTYILLMPELNALIVHMKADPATLAIASHLTGSLYYYDVSILNNINQAVANPYRYYIEYRPKYYYYDLLYNNSLSGFDFVRVKGDIDESFDREFEEIDGGFNLNDWTDKVKMHETKHAGLTVRRKYKGDVGYQRTKNQQGALVELLVSSEIYHFINNRWVPLLTLQKDQDLGFLSDKKRSFPIEWSLSESNEVYTPVELNFGEGAISPEVIIGDDGGDGDCIAITFEGSPALPDGQVGEPYAYSFRVNGSGTIIMNIIGDIPNWMDINFIDGEVQVTGTPDVAATGINVSLTFTNCGGSVPFTDTLDIAPLPEVTFSGHNECMIGSQFSTFVLNGPAGTVVGISLSMGGIINYSIASSHPTVAASCHITGPTNDGSANIDQVWNVSDLTGNTPFALNSPAVIFFTIPPLGQITFTVLCNLNNGGTFVNGTFKVVSVDGVDTFVNTFLCAGYSTG